MTSRPDDPTVLALRQFAKAEEWELRCPCGGEIDLRGEPAPVYRCMSCFFVAGDLQWLVRKQP